MLKEICCEFFAEKKILFHEGLNVVLGDNHSTNSIGKSTLLMIIDFVHGGGTYLTKNSGAITALGDHTINFSFEFNKSLYFFSRSTSDGTNVLKCDEAYRPVAKWEIDEFTHFLKQNYTEGLEKISFRSIVSLYSRVWGKENANVDKPLQAFPGEQEPASINTLIKLFNRYNEIEATSVKLKEASESKKIIDGAIKKNFIKKTTKTEYKTNEIRIKESKNEIQQIKDNLLRFTVNVNELTDKELLDLKAEKNKFLDARSLLQNKIKRIELNIANQSAIKSKQLSLLTKFFPNPNIAKIEQIESFHSKISNILINELTSSKVKLEEEDGFVQSEIDKIDARINTILSGVESPKYIVDRIFDLTMEANQLETANKFYDEKQDIQNKITEAKSSLKSIIKGILSDIELQINNSLSTIHSEIHGKNKQPPQIRLKEKSYQFDHFNNTGTGKCYIDLIIFDLSIINLTQLPFIIHDSPLFKNIEDFSVDKIIAQYNTYSKQIFIAIDGIEKYDSNTKQILHSKKVLELNNSKLLFTKDWRENKS